ncbi:MAG: hypothetical protein P1P89_19940 [Desulfobacterales bacterium]|nr:hypothetical protein [Desulfobacterales bacterium]
MHLKFWQKKEGEASSRPGEVKLPGPKGMPEQVGRYLVVRLGQDPDWVWNLRSVSCPHLEKKEFFDVRIFDENHAIMKNVTVKNYNSLEGHPELILYEGWYNKKTMKAEVKTKEAPLPRAA